MITFNRFNLDIRYCDPDVWYIYMLDKRPLLSKYILALDALLLLNSDLQWFYAFIKEHNIEDEVHDLLHAIPMIQHLFNMKYFIISTINIFNFYAA